MTPKELLYIDDTMGMEQHLQLKCTECSQKIQNAELRNMVSELAQEHQLHFNNLMSLLN